MKSSTMAKTLMLASAMYLAAPTQEGNAANRYELFNRYFNLEAKINVDLGKLSDRSAAGGFGISRHIADHINVGASMYGSFPPKLSYQFWGLGADFDYDFSTRFSVGAELGGSKVSRQLDEQIINGKPWLYFDKTAYMDASIRIKFKNFIAQAGRFQNETQFYLGVTTKK